MVGRLIAKITRLSRAVGGWLEGFYFNQRPSTGTQSPYQNRFQLIKLRRLAMYSDDTSAHRVRLCARVYMYEWDNCLYCGGGPAYVASERRD